ncbi:hypothetical protein Y032_0174g438 [Ancylostoma ceylanicum]|uniref:Uncharacterized protein n=1 Tax=Ancylostoma ceylanicum TaxID=53326 RepID=A0A016SUH0_9BILA|nr:hypothetical protein Y032_0174g438 [Ancylostoma ceylanicum]
MPQMHNTSVLQHLLSTASYDATSYISRVRRLSSFALPASRHPVSRLNLFTRFLKDVSDVSTARVIHLKKIEGLRDCTIAAGPERGMQREHAPSERIE